LPWLEGEEEREALEIQLPDKVFFLLLPLLPFFVLFIEEIEKQSHESETKAKP
jgi:hypothetical protein